MLGRVIQTYNICIPYAVTDVDLLGAAPSGEINNKLLVNTFDLHEL